MRTAEITLQELNTEQFIAEKVSEISSLVGDGTAHGIGGQHWSDRHDEYERFGTHA